MSGTSNKRVQQKSSLESRQTFETSMDNLNKFIEDRTKYSKTDARNMFLDGLNKLLEYANEPKPQTSAPNASTTGPSTSKPVPLPSSSDDDDSSITRHPKHSEHKRKKYKTFRTRHHAPQYRNRYTHKYLKDDSSSDSESIYENRYKVKRRSFKSKRVHRHNIHALIKENNMRAQNYKFQMLMNMFSIMMDELL